MNSKKAKKLRMFVKVLQEKGAIESSNWIDVTSDTTWTVAGKSNTRKLDPTCGKAIYKAMKKRAQLTSK